MKHIFSRITVFLTLFSQLISPALASETDNQVLGMHTYQTIRTGNRYTDVTTFSMDGYNYLRLRELGQILDFAVDYNAETDCIELHSDKPYDTSAGYLPTYVEQMVIATPTSQTIMLDGEMLDLNGYMVSGYNYFKLRDLAKAMNFSLIYNEIDFTVELDRNHGYFEHHNNTIVLMYHSFCETEAAAMVSPTVYTTIDKFKQDINNLFALGFESISLEDYYEGKADPNKKYFIITVDDGYLDNYTLLYPALQELGVHADIFSVVKDLSGGRDTHFTYDQAREMEKSGYVSVHCHNLEHLSATKTDSLLFKSMITTAISSLKKELNKDTLFFAYPYGEHNADTYMIVKEAGFELQLVQGRLFVADDIMVRTDMYYTSDINDIVNRAVYN